MKIIHKHKIKQDGEVTVLQLPVNSRALSVDYLVNSKALFMWVEIPAELNALKEDRSFRVFKTGDGIPEANRYVGTAIDQYVGEAYHVYEVV